MSAESLPPLVTLAATTVLEGVRQRLLLFLGWVLLVGFILAGFAGSLAVTEVQQTFNGLLGGYLRLAAVLLTALYVLSGQAREYQEKGLALIFSLSISRSVYFVGKLTGYALLIVFVVGLFCGALLFFASPAQVALWGGSLFLELLIVAVFSFLVQLTVRQLPVAFLAVLFFYLLSRTMANLQLVGRGAIMPQSDLGLQIMNAVLDAIAFILPALDRFTQSEWLVYGQGGWGDVLFVSIQGMIYLMFLCAIALLDLHRKSL